MDSGSVNELVFMGRRVFSGSFSYVGWRIHKLGPANADISQIPTSIQQWSRRIRGEVGEGRVGHDLSHEQLIAGLVKDNAITV